MQDFLAILLFPLMLLNLFGGVASGIWLAILHQWEAIGLGLASFAAPPILALMEAPGILIGAPGLFLIEKRRYVLAAPFFLLSKVYSNAVISAWCIFSFYTFLSGATAETFWPLLIWSYSVALGPWMYLASHERQTEGFSAATITLFITQLAYVVIMLMVIFSKFPLIGYGTVFSTIMLAGAILTTAIAYHLLKAQREAEFKNEMEDEPVRVAREARLKQEQLILGLFPKGTLIYGRNPSDWSDSHMISFPPSAMSVLQYRNKGHKEHLYCYVSKKAVASGDASKFRGHDFSKSVGTYILPKDNPETYETLMKAHDTAEAVAATAYSFAPSSATA